LCGGKSSEHKDEVREFVEWLVHSLRRCLSFHALHTSQEYRERWDGLLKKAETRATVYQYITTRSFRQLIKVHFQTEKDSTHGHSSSDIRRRKCFEVCGWIQKKIDIKARRI
jgi:hypothetical protein